jgi:DNA polymerase-3 subunit delta
MQTLPFSAICSDDTLLTQEAVDAWRKNARANGFTEREVFDIAGQFNWAGVLDALQSMSLFGDKKIIELRMPTGKPGKEGGDAIKTLCAHTSPDVSIMLTLPRADKAMKSAVWFKHLSSNATINEINSIALAQLPRFLSERLKKNGQSASPQALQLMSQQFEGNLIAANQEIEKLALLFPKGELSDSDIQKSVFNVARYDVFSLSEALLAGDVARVCRMIEGLKAEGEAIVLVIWALTEDLRVMTSIKESIQSGGNLHSLMREKRIWGAREKLMPTAIAALSLPFLKNALSRMHDIDKAAKGLSRSDVWDAALQLASQIALRIRKPR